MVPVSRICDLKCICWRCKHRGAECCVGVETMDCPEYAGALGQKCPDYEPESKSTQVDC